MQIDMTRPNPARLIDYWLGGRHYFEIDRQFGDQVALAVPVLPRMMRDTRALLKRVVRYWIEDCGLRQLVDFGAGLPTCNNTHLVAHEFDPQTRVLYDDIDLLTVSYGRQILENVPNTRYVPGDATEPRRILEQEESEAFLGGEHRVGIVYIGLAHMMSDEQIRSAAQGLYDWANPGSYWFITHAPLEWDTSPSLAAAAEFYRKARIQFFLRSPEQFFRLLAPWKLAPGGATLNLQWGLANPDPFPAETRYSFELMVYHE